MSFDDQTHDLRNSSCQQSWYAVACGWVGPPLEWLETQICDLAAHLAAAAYRFLVLLGDFDERRGRAEWDLPSCAAWLRLTEATRDYQRHVVGV